MIVAYAPQNPILSYEGPELLAPLQKDLSGASGACESRA